MSHEVKVLFGCLGDPDSENIQTVIGGRGDVGVAYIW